MNTTSDETSERGQMVRMVAAIALMIVLFGLFLAACGATPTPQFGDTPIVTTNTPIAATIGTATKPATKIDPCTLVTNAEIVAVLGGQVEGAKPSERGPYAMCNYSLPTASFALHNFLISVNIAPASPATAESEAKTGAAFLEQPLQPMPGVGDAAYSVGEEWVYVSRHNIGFNLYFPYGSKEPGTLDKMRALAAKIAEKL